MSIDIAASLNEHQRNALLSYYMGQYVPASGNDTLISLVQTPEDVYEYLLIDPLVSNAVPTTRVAQAMSSIQQYINSISMNMEPGYQTQSLDQDSISNWKGGLNQYDIWAGEVELDTYPENYIDPTLRQNQTTCFKELITDLNQNTINNDTAQQAVMNYLNRFEEVANLTIVSGYIDGTDQTQDMYYLLGKSITSPVQYYWRSFDMSQNVDNVVSTSAWSEWFPMNTSINEDSLQGIPRLAYFNNRLYLLWFEKTTGGNIADKTDGSTYDIITAYSSYCDFSNNWSAPYTLMTVEQSDSVSYYSDLFNASDSMLSTLCIYSEDSDKLVVSLYVAGTGNYPYSDMSMTIDYWFSVTPCQSGIDDIVPGLTYALENYKADSQAKVQSIYRDNENSYSIKSVSSITGSSYSDFSSGSLPVLDKNNFAVSVDENINLTCSIPLSFNTSNVSTTRTGSGKAYWGDPDYSLGNITFSYPSGNITSFTNVKIGPVPSSWNVGQMKKYMIVHDDIQGSWKNIDISVPDVNGMINVYGTLTCDSVNNKVLFNFSDTTGRTTIYTDAITVTHDQWTFNAYQDQWNGSKLFSDGPKNSFNTSGTENFTVALTNSLENITFNLYFGYDRDDGKTIHIGYSVIISAPTVDLPPVPSITHSKDIGDGVAVYLNFGDSTFVDGTQISNIRLNTLFAKQLINKAAASMQALLNWDTQLTLEPPMTTDGTGYATPMGFSDANGIYFWELFFYMPYLVAWRLYQEQQFSEAQAWFNYIFDPSARGRDNSSEIRTKYPEPDYWSVRPLVEVPASGAQASAVWLTTDPDALASANPVHYQKSIFMAYISNLLATGDASYRRLTSDSLSLARLQYSQVKDLLGPRPDMLIINHWTPETLSELSASIAGSVELNKFECQEACLPAFPGRGNAADTPTTNDNFMAPVNTLLLSYWNTMDSRLYNLHHQLTIDGQPMTLPLYAAPVNPIVLMEQSVESGSLVNTSSGIVSVVPPFRFTVMLQSARSAVATLSQFGQTLLSYCERQDTSGLQELSAQLAFNISGYTLTLQQNAIDAIDKEQESLQVSLSLAQQRRDHYQGLFNGNISSSEQEVMNMQTSSASLMTAAEPLTTAGYALNMAPNIFGLADGGSNWGAAAIASGIVLELSAQSTNVASQRIQLSEEYRRRREEWQIQYQQAQSEMDVINSQLDTLSVRRTGAVTALQLAQAQQDNLKTTLSFLTTRFTQSALYNWLTGQLSALYYQAYDVTLSLCLSAEACWQYEMGDITSRFIQTNLWNDNFRGLLVGETLQLNLQQMESAWLNRYVRRLELARTLSLKQLLEFSTDPSDWDDFITSGKTTFSLTESLYDSDYPGHYLRQIKSVTVTLPALVGPYQDIRMTLTQSGSRVLLKADIEGVKYLNDPSSGGSANILVNPRASQQIAVSSGLNDAGLFVLSFGDERYLPFEGTGAVSDWQIAFPNPTSTEQAALLASLNDVILQVHYTALYGGSSFEQAVSAL